MIWLFLGAGFVGGWFGLLVRARFARLAVTPREAEPRAEGTLETVYFSARDGTQLEGWLLLPTAPRPPLLVMAPGLGGTKDSHLEPFAWRFVREGVAVLLFDFRSFGGSDGMPRHHVDLGRHRDDYLAALAFARGELSSRVDAARVGLWGTSFSGGSALLAADTDRGISALLLHAPYLETPPHLEPRGVSLARFVACAVLDSVGVLPPIYVPLYGRPGEWAFCQSPEVPHRDVPEDPTAATFFRSLPKPLRGGWENRMLARMLATVDQYRPMDAVKRLQCPVLFVAADRDDLVPLGTVVRAHAEAPSPCKELVRFDCSHFDLYLEPWFTPDAEAQVRFAVATLKSGNH